MGRLLRAAPIRMLGRLDVRLSLVVFSVLALWLGSFVISTRWLASEKTQRILDLENERISLMVDGAKSRLMSDILLGHTDAIDLAVNQLFQGLSLTRIELRIARGGTIARETPGPKGEHINLERAYPLTFDGGTFGEIRVYKEIPLISSDFFPFRLWLVGLVVILVLVWMITRAFIHREIIAPIRQMIQGLSPDASATDSLPLAAPSSDEIAELARALRELKQKNQDYQHRLVETEKQAALGKLASQVAHDIKSPVAALQMAVQMTQELPEDARLLIRSAVARIRDIAQELVQAHRVPAADAAASEAGSIALTRSILAYPHLESVVSEKRIQLRSRPEVQLELTSDSPEACLAFVRVHAQTFERALSNLLDNAVEALRPEGGTIALALSVRPESSAGRGDSRVLITVSDNGIGIPARALAKVGTRGWSSGKKNGSGLGVYQARTSVETWGGKLQVRSDEGSGTQVSIELPTTGRPEWIAAEIVVPAGGRVVALDDDPSIHQVWKSRLSEHGIEVHHCTTPACLADWHRMNAADGRPTVYLVDYELRGSRLSGLDLIESLEIARDAILVTSRSEEPEILTRSWSLGVRVVPKGVAGFVCVRSGSVHQQVTCMQGLPSLTPGNHRELVHGP